MTSPRTAGFSLRVHATDGHARTGVLTTPHGDVPLPTFMPVGTQGMHEIGQEREGIIEGA